MNVDNVIILGAGASFDAGIPLIDGFVEKIRYFAWKGESKSGQLIDEDKGIFHKAIEIMNELDSYHGRAAFDDRNLEDLLSILAFNELGGGHEEKLKLEQMIEAVTRTIELTCDVQHNGDLSLIQHSGNEVYRDFWRGLFTNYNKTGQIPTLVTLNYDLVVERALLQTLITDEYMDLNFDGIILDYYYSGISFSYKFKEIKIRKRNYYDEIKYFPGRIVEPCNITDLQKPLHIDLLKLHGSVNFPKVSNTKNSPVIPIHSPIEKPFIIPPISNKSISNKSEKIWRIALDRIQKCKNLYIVGYSLPKTDIYFQFFLKTALGPNRDFNKIFIYNPALFQINGETEIKKRYEDCFPEQLRRYIEFFPKSSTATPGSFKNFVQNLTTDGFFY